MAATSGDFRNFQNLSLKDQYNSLSNNFNILNDQFKEALYKPEKHTTCEFKIFQHSLALVSKSMERLVREMEAINPEEASSYRVLQNGIESEIAERTHEFFFT